MKRDKHLPRSPQSFELLRCAGVTAEDLSPAPVAVSRPGARSAAVVRADPLDGLAALFTMARLTAIALNEAKRRSDVVLAEYRASERLLTNLRETAYAASLPRI